ncbi:hypothetical protein P691DRAFT_780019 [Macrolepiota fuliginosa MF-IS2]|uniref:NACHT domain-containing protein n=1 Tax=Macrolepiota fuliginosa MF-IS2 TaxID=1400762 RepID=A0A9P6BWN2_9AGAR|nr:hypothetical protein P691DRAFT_780019 [Macrolepiota fuliginosa MF-IS2]
MKGKKRKQSDVTQNSPNTRGRKKRRRGIAGRDGGDSGSNPTIESSNIQAISDSGFSRELLTSVASNPPSVGPSSRVFHTRSSGSATSNPTPYTGQFGGAHHFIINHPTMMDGDNTNERRSIKLLLQHVIVGAEFDSSDHRPSCHPETRLDITSDILSWMHNPARKYKILWINGPAGVGKSAILQTIAETEADSPTSILGATLFFSRPNNRDDPKCIFTTIAYRLAVRYAPYRQYIVKLLTLDPALVGKSMKEQFKAFIVLPFVKEEVMTGLHDTVLILLDRLDEYKGEEAQREIILLIGEFTLQYPTSPLIWLIASRPESHIQVAFSSRTVQLSYGEIQVSVDSDQGRRDVEIFLRASFSDIRERYPQSIPSALQQWPSESDFSTIATRSSGLFIFPSTIIRFIGDEDYADPISRLKTVLEVIASTISATGGNNPFAMLDALYTRILSDIPQGVLPTTLNLLLMPAIEFDLWSFAETCNMLGFTQGCAYGALRRLRSVLNVPEPQNAFQDKLETFHASFYDYLISSSRSGALCVIAPEIIQHHILRWIRILLESHSAETSDVDYRRVGLSWPIETETGRARVQRRIFRESIWRLICVQDEFVNDSVLNEFSKTAAFFRDLDFGDGLNDPIVTALAYSVSVFAAKLECWGVLKTVPLQSFDFHDIRPDLYREITRYQDRGCTPRDVWDSQELPDPVWQRVFHQRGRHKSQGFMLDSFSEVSTWKIDLEKNLATWTKMAPSHPIIMLGKGRKSCVTFDFEASDEEFWLLSLPCVQSS